MAWNGQGSPCGPAFPHYFCRQFGYCVLGQTPKDVVVDTLDRVNAVIMAGTTWVFFISAIAAAVVYEDGNFDEMYYKPKYEGFNRVVAIILIINGVLSMFPTFYSITICNIFKAKVLANAVWNVPLVMASIAFTGNTLRGTALMQFALGWSISMFVVTGAKEQRLLCYPSAVAFVVFAFIFGATEVAVDFYPPFFVACFMFGFMAWNALEGYAHVDLFGRYPDQRVWLYSGPHTLECPPKSRVPSAYED